MEVPNSEVLREPLTPQGSQELFELIEKLAAIQAPYAGLPQPTDAERKDPTVLVKPHGDWRVDTLEHGERDASYALVIGRVGSDDCDEPLRQSRVHVSRSGNRYIAQQLHPRDRHVRFATTGFSPSEWTPAQGRVADLVSVRLLVSRAEQEAIAYTGLSNEDMTVYEQSLALGTIALSDRNTPRTLKADGSSESVVSTERAKTGRWYRIRRWLGRAMLEWRDNPGIIG